MPDTVARFYQGFIAVSGTNITGIPPAGTNYTVKHIIISNVTSGTNSTFSVALNSLASRGNYILPSGVALNASEYAETTDIFVLNPGEAIYASAGADSVITASVHGVIST